MNHFKVTFEDGNTLTTGMNATLAEAEKYYIGTAFNFGDTEEHPKDKMVKAVKVEQLGLKLQDIQANIEEQQQKLAILKEMVKTEITNLPDNPNIKRLTSNCFIVSSKDLGNNWTPEYHDYKWQYAELGQVIDRTAPEKLFATLTDIMETGKLYNNNRDRTIYFHPDVIKHLQTLLL